MLLNSIAFQDYIAKRGGYVNVDSKMVSNLLGKKNDVHQDIINVSAIPEVIAEATKYFKKEVIPKLNPHTDEDMYTHLINAINTDTEIAYSKRTSLLALHANKENAKFLALTFLYVLY